MFLDESEILLEKAKWDFFLDNIAQEGEDYRELKEALQDVMDANSTIEKDFKRPKRPVLHAIKRFFQVAYDIDYVLAPFSIVALICTAGAYAIPSVIVYIISNRAWRFAIDTVEYNNLVKDTREIISQMKRLQNKVKDKKQKEKLQKGIERLEKLLREQDN